MINHSFEITIFILNNFILFILSYFITNRVNKESEIRKIKSEVNLKFIEKTYELLIQNDFLIEIIINEKELDISNQAISDFKKKLRHLLLYYEINQYVLILDKDLILELRKILKNISCIEYSPKAIIDCFDLAIKINNSIYKQLEIEEPDEIYSTYFWKKGSNQMNSFE